MIHLNKYMSAVKCFQSERVYILVHLYFGFLQLDGGSITCCCFLASCCRRFSAASSRSDIALRRLVIQRRHLCATQYLELFLQLFVLLRKLHHIARPLLHLFGFRVRVRRIQDRVEVQFQVCPRYLGQDRREGAGPRPSGRLLGGVKKRIGSGLLGGIGLLLGGGGLLVVDALLIGWRV
ncbi:hypothetical protein B0H11DRAFT_2073644 [Mycena galericulata]|nr:hypothetical protein B0H11DRAFT_2073644 [Mycena galericulata]